jgi:hypothetical protein
MEKTYGRTEENISENRDIVEGLGWGGNAALTRLWSSELRHRVFSPILRW